MNDAEYPLPKEATRRCLGCGKPFRSAGPSNRFCRTCRKQRRKLDGGLASAPVDERYLRGR